MINVLQKLFANRDSAHSNASEVWKKFLQSGGNGSDADAAALAEALPVLGITPEQAAEALAARAEMARLSAVIATEAQAEAEHEAARTAARENESSKREKIKAIEDHHHQLNVTQMHAYNKTQAVEKAKENLKAMQTKFGHLLNR